MQLFQELPGQWRKTNIEGEHLEADAAMTKADHLEGEEGQEVAMSLLHCNTFLDSHEVMISGYQYT